MSRLSRETKRIAGETANRYDLRQIRLTTTDKQEAAERTKSERLLQHDSADSKPAHRRARPLSSYFEPSISNGGLRASLRT